MPLLTTSCVTVRMPPTTVMPDSAPPLEPSDAVKVRLLTQPVDYECSANAMFLWAAPSSGGSLAARKRGV